MEKFNNSKILIIFRKIGYFYQIDLAENITYPKILINFLGNSQFQY